MIHSLHLFQMNDTTRNDLHSFLLWWATGWFKDYQAAQGIVKTI